MSKRIFKYQLGSGDTALNVRKDSQVVLVGEQKGYTHLWIADDDQYAHEEQRTFCVVGTGWIIDKDWKHIGSHQAKDGFVWHVYEVLS